MGVHYQRGFTLIELIMVVVLMSIIAMAGIQIIGTSADAYARLSGRQTMSNSARLAVEKISREVRTALPGSARISGACLEFIPVITAGKYIDLPLSSAATSFKAIAFAPGSGTPTGRVSVYPIAANPYDLSENLISAVATTSVPDVDNEITVTMGSSHQFPNVSPNERFFLIGDPVSYCVSADRMFRFQNYGFNTLQPIEAGLPAALPNRALLVNQVTLGSNPFVVLNASLQRNALVNIVLSIQDGSETVLLNNEVQLRNVP